MHVLVHLMEVIEGIQYPFRVTRAASQDDSLKLKHGSDKSIPLN